MFRRIEIPVLILTDTATFCIAWAVYYLLRVQTGWIAVSATPDFAAPMVAVSVFWVLVFALVGLYRPWYAASRFDEIALLFKTITIGCLILFFAIFVDDEGRSTGVNSRLLIAIYWGILLICVGAGRMSLRSIQRRMLIAGIGAHNTLIVGSLTKAHELFDEVAKYPALGYRVKGFVGVDRRRMGVKYRGIPLVGAIDDLSTVMKKQEIREILIALDSKDHDRLLEIILQCNSHKVGLKIMPDLYDIISGQARTNQIYGFPLIEIRPELMRPWEQATKRGIDIAFSLLVLGVGLPIWLLLALAIKLDSRGSVFYRQERVGKDGQLFSIVKFRSMVEDAERQGPQWAGRRDPRVTRVGQILRRLHLDEIPQFFNVLYGQMSLIGPRPERPVFVEKLSREIPMYPRRLKVRPGITGWAQVKHKYDETIEDVRKKVQYDLFYIENMSLRMDFKIILSTLNHMLLGRGR